MKTRIFALLVISSILILLTSMATENEKFYYSFGKKTFLKVKPNTLLVKFYSDTINRVEKEKILIEAAPNVKIKWHCPLIVEISCSTEKAKKELEETLRQKKEVKTCLPFYVSLNGVDMGV
ncbi:MAG: hypothetical protein AB7S54_13205, partial [Bacteroidales bacterium]